MTRCTDKAGKAAPDDKPDKPDSKAGKAAPDDKPDKPDSKAGKAAPDDKPGGEPDKPDSKAGKAAPDDKPGGEPDKPDSKAGKAAPNKKRKTSKSGKKDKRVQKYKEEVNIDKFIREMTDKPCSKICLELLGTLGLIFSDNYNALWGLNDVYRFLVSMCAHAGTNGTAEGQHKASIDKSSIAKLPTRKWLFGKINQPRYDFLLTRCTEMISRTVRRARRHGMLRGAVDVSIDLHDIPLYAKVLKLIFAVMSKPKKGSTVFTRLATIHCVTNGQRLTLGVLLIKRDDALEDTVARLYAMCKKNRVHINSVTLDRGFYSTRVVDVLIQHGVKFLMPAVKRPSVKKILEGFTKKDSPVLTHTMISDDKKISCDVIMVITERPKKKKNMTEENRKLMELYEKETEEFDKFIPFVTNMEFSDVSEDPEQVAEFYRRRWGIETSYKSYEQIRPWTTSTSYNVRILLLFFPFVLYNAWILANYMAMRRADSIRGMSGKPGGYTRPACPLGRFTGILFDMLNTRALEAKSCKKPPDRTPYAMS